MKSIHHHKNIMAPHPKQMVKPLKIILKHLHNKNNFFLNKNKLHLTKMLHRKDRFNKFSILKKILSPHPSRMKQVFLVQVPLMCKIIPLPQVKNQLMMIKALMMVKARIHKIMMIKRFPLHQERQSKLAAKKDLEDLWN